MSQTWLSSLALLVVAVNVLEVSSAPASSLDWPYTVINPTGHYTFLGGVDLYWQTNETSITFTIRRSQANYGWLSFGLNTEPKMAGTSGVRYGNPWQPWPTVFDNVRNLDSNSYPPAVGPGDNPCYTNLGYSDVNGVRIATFIRHLAPVNPADHYVNKTLYLIYASSSYTDDATAQHDVVDVSCPFNLTTVDDTSSCTPPLSPSVSALPPPPLAHAALLPVDTKHESFQPTLLWTAVPQFGYLRACLVVSGSVGWMALGYTNVTGMTGTSGVRCNQTGTVEYFRYAARGVYPPPVDFTGLYSSIDCNSTEGRLCFTRPLMPDDLFDQGIVNATSVSYALQIEDPTFTVKHDAAGSQAINLFAPSMYSASTTPSEPASPTMSPTPTHAGSPPSPPSPPAAAPTSAPSSGSHFAAYWYAVIVVGALVLVVAIFGAYKYRAIQKRSDYQTLN